MPRSPSRDLSERYDGNRQYFRRGNWLTRWRWRLAGLALLIAGGWIAAGYVLPGAATDYRYTHGPLAAPHASLDSDCAACHRASSPDALSVGTVLRADTRWLDLTCTTACHRDTAPHYPGEDMKVGGTEGCAACHHDHLGRDNNMVRPAAQSCARCHADLASQPNLPQGRVETKIPDFAAHPEFRPLSDEAKTNKYQASRGLKFSHAVHLSAGIKLPGVDKPFTVGDLDKLTPGAGAKLQPGKQAAAEVTLDCGACHQLDGRPGTKGFSQVLDVLSANPRGAASPLSPAGGAYYLPVKFDLHCKACHPTTAPATAAGGAVLPAVPVPHGEQPDALAKFLEGAYAGELFGKDSKLKGLKPTPGERFDSRPTPEAKAFGETLKTLVSNAMKDGLLIRPVRSTDRGEGCLKCHDLSPGGGTFGTVRPVNFRTVWFPAARFNHTAHLTVAACTDCHPGAGGEPKLGADGSLVEREPVNILGVASCQKCHAPKTDAPGTGVRHGCSDCHRYHLVTPPAARAK